MSFAFCFSEKNEYKTHAYDRKIPKKCSNVSSMQRRDNFSEHNRKERVRGVCKLLQVKK